MPQLSARTLRGFTNANNFADWKDPTIVEGSDARVYLRLTDSSLDTAEDGYQPPGRRYLPEAGASLEVSLSAAPGLKVIRRAAFMPAPADDRSIWAFDVRAADGLTGTAIINLRLIESSGTSVGRAVFALRITPTAAVVGGDDCGCAR